MEYTVVVVVERSCSCCSR